MAENSNFKKIASEPYYFIVSTALSWKKTQQKWGFFYFVKVFCNNFHHKIYKEQVKKAFCYQKLFRPFTVWINCSIDLKIFANSWHSASNFKSFSRSQLFLTVGHNNLGNKIPFPAIFPVSLLWFCQTLLFCEWHGTSVYLTLAFNSLWWAENQVT